MGVVFSELLKEMEDNCSTEKKEIKAKFLSSLPPSEYWKKQREHFDSEGKKVRLYSLEELRDGYKEKH